MLAAVAAGAYAIGTGGDGEIPAETTGTVSHVAGDAEHDERVLYLDAIQPLIAKLSRSAAIMGRVLTETAAPTDLKRLRMVAQQQQRPLHQSRTQLAHVSPPRQLGAAHRKLVSATAAHRRLLALIARATRSSSADVDATLRQTAGTARSTLGDYRAFFASTNLDNTVRGVGLADTTGLAAALRERERDRRAEQEIEGGDESSSAPNERAIPRVFEGEFSSVRRPAALLCDQPFRGVQFGRKRAARVPDGRGRSGVLGLLGAGPEAGPRMPIGSSFRTYSGEIRCDSGRFGIRRVIEASAFYIGDRYVRIVFADVEQRFDA